MKKLFILDAAGTLYRAYHAIASHLTNQAGETTHALFGFVRSIKKIEKEFHPDHFVAVFDGKNNIASRKKIYSEYKAHREAMPEDMRQQYRSAMDYCNIAGVPFLCTEGVEADDTIASLAHQWTNNDQDVHVYIVSSDKDLCQLVTARISIINPAKDYREWRPDDVKEIFGVEASKLSDYLAIIGDTSDNIPGIPGLGKKAAQELLSGDLFLKDLLEVPEKAAKPNWQALLKEHKKIGELSLALARMDKNLTISLNKEDYKLKEADKEKLKEFYRQHNFFSFLKELDEGSSKQEVSYQLIDSTEALDDLCTHLLKTKQFAIDTETTGLNVVDAELVGIGFCTDVKQAFYVPLNHTIKRDVALEKLKAVLENPEISVIGHNIKYDLLALEYAGIHSVNIAFDTMVASYLLNAHQRSHSLDVLSLERFGKVKTAIENLIGKGKKAITMKEVEVHLVSDYCSEDVDYTFRLKQLLEKELEERGLESLFYDVELALIPVLMRMEMHGIYVNTEHLKNMHKKVEKELATLEKEIIDLAGEPFNIKSPKQLGQILFETLGIPAPKKTATGYSTSVDVLESLKDQYPIVEKVMEFRVLEKLRSTYIDALPLEVSAKDLRIHCSFGQSVAATGRLTCHNPNLQNIPVKSEMGREIRAAFCPEKEDFSFISADYSQIELRLLAHFSADKALLKAFSEGEDVHASTAASIFDVSVDAVTKEQRRRAKIVNFGILYGQGPFGLSKEIGCTLKEAQDFIHLYFEKFSGVKAYIKEQIEFVRKHKVAKTLLGRERLIPEIDSKNAMVYKAAERLSVNTPLQGSTADLMKLAMVDIDKKLKRYQYEGYMVLQVHDELIFEVHDSLIEEVSDLVRLSMESCYPLKVPLVVEVAFGKNWKEC